jgi:Flp pilus assembly protein TadD
VYHRVDGFAFVFDDQGFLHDNPTVLNGLTVAGIRWALTTFSTGNWYPLTWVSHMVDVQLFGLRPGPHHLVNCAFHALNTALLFLVLRRLTGAFWSCAFVAALFAVHPLHVESVAWIAERKDLLSGLCWILALGAYGRYAAFPGVRRYALVVLVFVLGLMAKPMVVTLPAVLLLLDWWPLGRLPRAGAGGKALSALVIEKIPLFALAAAVGLVTARAQESVGAMASDAVYRPAWRVANALIANAVYLGKFFWPTDLAAYYPFQLGGRPAWQVGAALLLPVGVSIAAIVARNRCPAFAVGWFWHLITLAPVIGLVQVGGQSRADRYMYLPLIGLGLAVAWCAPPLLKSTRVGSVLLAAIALVALAGLGVAAFNQSETWRTPLSLYSRMLAVTRGNWVAHHGYAVEVQKQGRLQEAIAHYRAAVAINFGAAYLRGNLAFALYDAGLSDEAIEQLSVFTRMSPGNSEANYRLGLLLGRAGRFSESLPALREATRLRPWFPPGWEALGVTCANLGLRAEAEAAFREVLRIEPGNQQVRRNLERLQALR